MKKLILIPAAFLSLNSYAAIHTIGDGASCDYDVDNYTLQQAIDDIVSTGDSNPLIRITNQQTFYENLDISSTMSLSGGFADCNAAGTNNSTGITTINGSNNGSVVKIFDNTSAANVSLHDIKLTNGKGIGSTYGGGLSLIDNNDQALVVTLNGVTISNSEGSYGGGIYMHGGSTGNLQPLLILNDTTVINNDGLNNGGGLYCYKGEVRLDGNSKLFLNDAYNNNSTYGHGGGVYLSSGCDLNIESSFDGQIYGNSASGHGGGVYVGTNSSVQAIGSPASAGIEFKGNFSDSNGDFYGNGGGIYLKGDSAMLNLFAVDFIENNAYYGGAISAVEGAQLTIGTQNNQCGGRSKCNVFDGNTASKNSGRGGAIHLNDATAVLTHIAAFGNRADLATVLYAENNSQATLKASMVYRNGNGGQNDWSDIYAYKGVGSDLVMVNVTSANNAVEGAVLSQTNGGHILLNSIFYEPLQNLLADFVSVTSIKDCLMMNDDNGMGPVTNSIIGSPSFVDAFNDDYHLSEFSNAIDMCGYTPLALTVDMDNNSTGWDDPEVTDMAGSYDAGADETYAGDVIFQSGF